MKLLAVISTIVLAAAPSISLSRAAEKAAPAPPAGQVDMAEMMKQARRFTEPSENHKLFARFIGTWDTETRMTIPGAQAAADKGTSVCSWLMEGRWVKCEGTGTVMGMPFRLFNIMGYDNFKMSYRVMTVTSMDTAMNTSEGDLDPGGKALITYGTLDEYLTGEHDKMVKYVWRLVSDDKITLEVHDLPIGEANTKVVEVTYKRRK